MTEEFPNIEAFYLADERRRRSPEADFGVWWIQSEEKQFPHWRVSYVRDTGEVYALEMGDGEQVIVLGTFPVDDVDEGEVYYRGLDGCLDGWSQLYPKPLAWVVERLQRAKQRRRRERPHRPGLNRDYPI